MGSPGPDYPAWLEERWKAIAFSDGGNSILRFQQIFYGLNSEQLVLLSAISRIAPDSFAKATDHNYPCPT